MRLFLNRLSVLTKRSFINPAMYVMFGVIIIMAALVIFVPEKETSIYIPIALINQDDSKETDEIVDSLCSMNSVFDFYEVEDEEELYLDLASGKANAGYIFPAGFSEHITENSSRYSVKQVETPGSRFILLSREEVFRVFYKYSARNIICETFAEYGYEVDVHDPDLERIFGKYINDASLFALESIEGSVYNEITRSEKIPIPLYKFAGFFIFTAALLGTLAFLNDQDNRIYLRFGLFERIYLGLIQVAVFTVPSYVISVICFLASGTEFKFLHVTVYTLLVTLLGFVLGTIMTILPIRSNRSRIFSAVLPVYLILSFIFSGILMDLTNFGSVLKTLSRIFPPSMF
ncbi:MAG: ABC transporter permease [Clostridiales bacterium]|nr:ABC transporter permease [Clostridiales bacterium]